LGPGEYALLGLLTLSGGSGYGYDLARHFGEQSGPLAEIIRLEPGMLYHHLKKLARDRLVATAVEAQSGRPARQTHAITEAGRRALDQWLREPVRATREIRLDFLLKLFFARRLAHRPARPPRRRRDSHRPVHPPGPRPPTRPDPRRGGLAGRHRGRTQPRSIAFTEA
jgi:DNA-binding PadR family transcriptional regulator